MLEYPLLLIFPAAMAFAAAMDLVTMTIPNRISLALVAAFVFLAPFTGIGWHALLVNHIAAGALVLVIVVGMFAQGWLGGGDAKLTAVIAMWVGFDHLLPFLVQMAVFGGMLSLAILSYRHSVPAGMPGLPHWAERLHERTSGIPYGIAIGGAGLAVYPSTPWFVAFAV